MTVKLLTKLEQAKKSHLRADYRYEMGLAVLLEYFNEDIGKSCCDHYDEEKYEQRPVSYTHLTLPTKA